jgi:hypothetical protein
MAPAPREAYATEQSQLLLFPEADGESLLGRSLQKSADGSWTMADARQPGCEVNVKSEKSAFRTSRKLDAHALTSIAGGYAKVVSLEAKFGRTNTAEIEIDNTAILRAETRGTCGDLVVDAVFVGHGKRRITANAEAAASADLHVGLGGIAPGATTEQSQADVLEWGDDQAYGFHVRESAKVEPLDMRVTMASMFDEGEEVTARFEVGRSAWLVVYAIDGSGHADVLWPSNEEPEPRAASAAPASLPSPRERAQGIRYRAMPLKPGQPSRETLVVYGFADKRDFDAMKPAAGAGDQDGPTYAAELTKKLQTVPISRWARAVVGYVIRPKP